MSVEECKQRLPLPDLLVKLGYPKPDAKGFLPSPLRPGESGDSFHVYQRNGVWFFKDHAHGAGGDEVDLIEVILGLNTKQAIEKYHGLAAVEWHKPAVAGSDRGLPGGKSEGLGMPAATYVYRHADGSHAFEVLRYKKDGGGKTFRQRRKAREGERSSNGWIWRVDEADRVLFRLPELLAAPVAEPVFLVEGEKDVKTLVSLGLAATCNAAGAGKWQANYSASLAGRWVVMVGDNDEAGRKHVAQVSELLRPVVARLSIIDMATHWAECPDKGDVSDWVDAMAVKAAERN